MWRMLLLVLVCGCLESETNAKCNPEGSWLLTFTLDGSACETAPSSVQATAFVDGAGMQINGTPIAFSLDRFDCTAAIAFAVPDREHDAAAQFTLHFDGNMASGSGSVTLTTLATGASCTQSFDVNGSR